MNDLVVTSVKLLFLLAFTLHNLEESVWLPAWSKHAGRFHITVQRNQFIFAAIIITVVVYLVTFVSILFDNPNGFANYIYLGFAGMIGLNSIFPHLATTLLLKKYSPGLITGLLLNLPISCVVIIWYMQRGMNSYYVILSVAIVTASVLISLKYLFALGGRLIKY
jgi:hypothetical protein